MHRHRIAAVLLAAGLALRVLVVMAYHPALLYIDSVKYLNGAWPGGDPAGYSAILKAILLAGDLGTVVIVQHLVGLAIAAVIYALLTRRGVPRWLAAAAMAPVLLDAYQLQIEQTIMPDLWFEALVVTCIAVLLWRPVPSVLVIAATGLLIGVAATVRQIGEALVLAALLYVAASAATRRQAIRGAAAMLFLFAVIMANTSGGSFSIEGRLAAAVDCATIRLTASERPLCPTPAEQARGADWLEHSRQSPLRYFAVPPGTTMGAITRGFDSAIARQQALRVVTSILRDSIRIFAATKTALPGVTPISRWQFQTRYPEYPPEITLTRNERIVLGIQIQTYAPFRFRVLSPAYGGRAQVDRPIAAILRAYQLNGGYTPGPLLAVCALAGLAGSACAFARRRRAGPHGGVEQEARSLALACLMFITAAIAILLISDLFEFSWRYQLPALVTLPPAGALGIWALRTALAPHRPANAESPQCHQLDPERTS